MNREQFKKDFAAFSFTQHQDVLTYLQVLEDKGWTIDDAKVWIKQEQNSKVGANKDFKEQIDKQLASLPKCPECQSPMQPAPVNTGPGDQTGDGSIISYTCTNPNCMHQIFE